MSAPAPTPAPAAAGAPVPAAPVPRVPRVPRAPLPAAVIREQAMAAAAAMALAPPLLNLAFEVRLYTGLARRLCRLHGVEAGDAQLRHFALTTLDGVTSGSALGRTLRAAGWVSYFASTLLSAGLASSLALAVGHVINLHLASGQGPSDMTPQRARDLFRRWTASLHPLRGRA